VKVAGKPLVPSKSYTVATNDFLAAGGDGYTVFADKEHVGDYAGLDEILIEYIIGKGTVSPKVEGRMNTLKASYVVKKGDVLWRIARSFGLEWREVAAFNEMANPHLILPGQTILIPGQSD
jgi:5'-nucleotidase